jgi:hypothetical protein
MTPELGQDYYRNAQAARVITSSLSLQEFNKIKNVEVAKDIWEILKESHEGTDMIKEGKIDVINKKLEGFVKLDDETIQQCFGRLMALINEIRALGCEDWSDFKVTKKMLDAYSPNNYAIAAMIRRDPSYRRMTPVQLLSELTQHDLAEKMAIEARKKRGDKDISLKAKGEVDEKVKSSKGKKVVSSDEEGSTNEETALLMRKFKSFMKKRNFKKNNGGKDKRRIKKRPCYECGEYGHFIAECPNKDKNKEGEKRGKFKKEDKPQEYKKSYDHKKKKKYQKQAHLCMEWISSDEESEDEEMATIAIHKPSSSSSRLFNNLSSDDEDDVTHCFMAKGAKVKSKYNYSSSTSSSSDIENDLDYEEALFELGMIEKFGKKGFKEIKKLLKKLDKRETSLSRQEDFLILEKKRNLALEEELAEERSKVEKLAIDLSLANNSKEKASKDLTLANDYLAKLESSYGELQNSFSCLEVKYKDLEVNYSTLWDSTSSHSKASLDPNASTSEGCAKCYNVDITACLTNIARLEDSIKAKDDQINRLNMLVSQRYCDDEKLKGKNHYTTWRHPKVTDGIGHTRGEKLNGRHIIKGKEHVNFMRPKNLGELMDVAHGVKKDGVSKDTTPRVKVDKKAKSMVKAKVIHEPSPSYTNDYMVTMDENNKMVVKSVGAYTKKNILRSVWVPRMFSANLKGPKSFWVPQPRA